MNPVSQLLSPVLCWLMPILCWLSHRPFNLHIHYRKQLKHKYCRCRPLVVTFVYYEFSTLLKLCNQSRESTTLLLQISRDWKCPPVISPDDMNFNQLAPFILGEMRCLHQRKRAGKRQIPQQRVASQHPCRQSQQFLHFLRPLLFCLPLKHHHRYRRTLSSSKLSSSSRTEVAIVRACRRPLHHHSISFIHQPAHPSQSVVLLFKEFCFIVICWQSSAYCLWSWQTSEAQFSWFCLWRSSACFLRSWFARK